MVGFARKFRFAFVLISLSLTLGGCDQATQLFKNLTGKATNETAKSPKSKKMDSTVSDETGDDQNNLDAPTKKTPKTTLSAKPNGETPNTTDTTAVDTLNSTEPASLTATKTTTDVPEQGDVVITQKNQTSNQSLKKTDLKSVTAPKFTINAPIDVTKRIGGIPQSLLVDDTYVYTDDSQDLSVYTNNLEFIHKIPRSFPIRKINRVVRDGKTYIFANEDNNVLEIFELSKDPETQKQHLTNVAGYDVGGTFSWLDPKTLLVFLPNKIQFLDFSDFNTIKVLRELPIGGVSDKIILKNNLYLSRGEFLDVLSLDTYTLTSSLRIGLSTQFLGATRENDKNFLYLAILNTNQQATGFQAMQLGEDLSGVIDFGHIEEFTEPLYNIKANLNLGVFFGLQNATPELAGIDHQAYLYHIKSKRFLRGPLTRDMKITSGEFFEDWLYAIHDGHLTQYKLSLFTDVIEKFKTLVVNPSDKPSLAQIGSEQTIKDEFEFKIGRSLNFETNTKSVFLLDQNHLVFLQDKSSQTQQIVVSENLNEENFTLRDLPNSTNVHWSNFLTTPFGLLMTAEDGVAHLLDVGLKSPTPLSPHFQNLKSWTVFQQNEGYLLVALSQNTIQYKQFKLKANKKHSWVIELYQMLSPSQINLVAQIPVENPGSLFSMGYDMFALATQTQIEFYTAREIQAPRLLEEETKPYTLPGTLLEARLSPQKDLIYAYVQDSSGKQIHVFDYENPTRRFLNINATDVTLDQFKGASFAKGGQLFILPTPRGTLFYDHTFISNQPEADTLKAQWPMPSESVDVANRGAFICVALNKSGVYCGDLLFY